METKREVNLIGEINAETLSEWRKNYHWSWYSPYNPFNFLQKLFGARSEIPDWVLNKSKELQKEKITDGSLYGRRVIRSLSGVGSEPNTGSFACFKSKQDTTCIVVLIDEREHPQILFDNKKYEEIPERGWVIAVFDQNTGEAIKYSLFDEKTTKEFVNTKQVLEIQQLSKF